MKLIDTNIYFTVASHIALSLQKPLAKAQTINITLTRSTLVKAHTTNN